MPWFKMEINFRLPDDLNNPDHVADELLGQCYQIVTDKVDDYNDDITINIVYEIDEDEKHY